MKKYILLIFSFFAINFLMPNVYAISIDDLAVVDDSITLTKKVDGTGFTAGNNLNLKNEFNGISFVAGNSINDSSKSDYSFIAGNNINLVNIETKDLFVAGNNITIDTDKIERDIYVVGNSIKIKGNLGRNIYVGSQDVEILGKVSGNVIIDAESIKLGNDFSAKLFKYNDDANVNIKNKSNIGKIKTYKNTSNKEVVDSLKNKIESTFGLFLNLLVIGLVLMLLFKGLFEKISDDNLQVSNFLKNILIGFCILIFVPICFLLLLISTIGISLAFILLISYILVIYLSSLFTGYYLSKKLLGAKINNDYVLLTIGLFVLYFVRFIPLLGSIITLLSLLFGIGIFLKTLCNIIKVK